MLERCWNTLGLFLGSAYLISKAIEDGLEHAARESPISLLTTSAILIPLATLIAIATKKIFDDRGWKSSECNFLIFTFTTISSVALTSAAAVGFGLTAFLQTGLTVCLIAFRLLLGVSCLQWGLENVFLHANHLPITGIAVV